MEKQAEFWSGEFGKDYTDRSVFSPEQLDRFYIEQMYGVSRSSMNRDFLEGLQVSSILEIGCNVGNQLRLLQTLGFERLYGIELQQYAVEKAKSCTENINFVQGNALDNPFRDSYFDLVYTSGVLIHISPDHLLKAMSEIHRTSKRYIWGLEYFAEEHQEIAYRGNNDALWKGDFARLYLENFPNLRLVKEKKFAYTNSNNVDSMFLLEKV